jgi:cell division transport system ATP-binding protein
MIQAFHVYKQYDRESSALSDVTLHIPRGEFCFLTGPSGAGKTTFLKLVFREELPSQGQILVSGRNVTAIPDRQIPELRRAIGVVFQDFKLLKRKTILENVAFVLRILAVPAKEQKRRAFAALKAVGLHHKMHAYPLQLSGGEQQRVAIARALINEPSLILADEPTGNLDSRTSIEVLGIFQRLNRERGITVLLITHESDIAEYGTRLIRFRDGRVVADQAILHRRNAADELAALPPPEPDLIAPAETEPAHH